MVILQKYIEYIYIMQQNDELFFKYNLFDTYYPFTMLNSHLFTKMNNSVGICVCLDNAIFRHSSSVPCLVG